MTVRLTVEGMKRTCTLLLEQAGLDPTQVWGTALTELADLADALDGDPIVADDAFCIGFALATYFATDTDGGVGPAAELPTPERTA